MAKIISQEVYNKRENYIKKFWDGISSLDIFTKSFIVIFLVLIVITPVFMSSLFVFSQYAFENGQKINFDNLKSGENLSGEYPSSIIDWGENLWAINNSTEGFDSKNIVFAINSRENSFTFVEPRMLISLQAYNHSQSLSSVVTVFCDEKNPRSVSLDPKEKITLVTEWNTKCRSITILSSNGPDTSLDNLVVSK